MSGADAAVTGAVGAAASDAASEYTFEVISNEDVAEGVRRMRVRSEVAALIAPGQFVNLRVPGDASHILRIPLSFSAADANALVVEFVYALVGEGTRRLAQMVAGDESTLVGPCGHGWRLPAGEGRALLVAGGVGLPPIAACARMLAEAGVSFDVVVGAQTGEKHVDFLIDELRSMTPAEACDCQRRVILTTDDGSRGMRGFATVAMEDLLAERRYACVYACGPQPMMAGVAALARKTGCACQVSMERMMGCGFGACSCCNVALAAGGYALCCSDGPVFDAEEVAW